MKREGCLGTAGLEEKYSGDFPGFPYCLPYVLNRILQKPQTGTNKKSPRKPASLLAQGPGKAWLKNRKPFGQYPPYTSQLSLYKITPCGFSRSKQMGSLSGSVLPTLPPHRASSGPVLRFPAWSCPQGSTRLTFHHLYRRSRQHPEAPTRKQQQLSLYFHPIPTRLNSWIWW